MHERIEGTVLAHERVEVFFHESWIFEKVDLYGRSDGAGRFDCGERRVGRRVAIGDRNTTEAVARQCHSGCLADTAAGPRHQCDLLRSHRRLPVIPEAASAAVRNP